MLGLVVIGQAGWPHDAGLSDAAVFSMVVCYASFLLIKVVVDVLGTFLPSSVSSCTS